MFSVGKLLDVGGKENCFKICMFFIWHHKLFKIIAMRVISRMLNVDVGVLVTFTLQGSKTGHSEGVDGPALEKSCGSDRQNQPEQAYILASLAKEKRD